jgi:hypothetical protein
MELRMLNHLEQDVYSIVDKDHAGILLDVMKDNPDPAALKAHGPGLAYYAVRFAKYAHSSGLDMSKYRSGTTAFTARELDWLVDACDVGLASLNSDGDSTLIHHFHRSKADLLHILLELNPGERRMQISYGEEMIDSLESALAMHERSPRPDTVYLLVRLARSKAKHAQLFISGYRKKSFKLYRQAFQAYERAIGVAKGLDGQIPRWDRANIYRKAADAAETVASFSQPEGHALIKRHEALQYLRTAAHYSQASSDTPEKYISAIALLNSGRLFMHAYLMDPSDMSLFSEGLAAYRASLKKSRHHDSDSVRVPKADGTYLRISKMIESLQSTPRKDIRDKVEELLSETSIRTPL